VIDLLSTLLALLLGGAGIWFAARRSGAKAAREKVAAEAEASQRKTRERIENADLPPLDDAGAMREWLRSRSPGKR
jgi:hypothetical protein